MASLHVELLGDREGLTYTITALWVAGFSQKAIGERLRLRTNQIRGILNRGKYPSRSAMTIEERQHVLDELALTRNTGPTGALDRGALDRFDWKAREISQRPRTKALKVALGPGYGGKGRRIVGVGRERPIAINTMSAPLEYLVERGWLEGPKDEAGAAGIRFSIALRLREWFEGAGVIGIRSAGLEERVSGGGSGAGFSDYRVSCIKALEPVKRAAGDRAYTMLERFLAMDEWVWNEVGPEARPQILEAIHRALDFAAYALRYLDHQSLTKRWGEAP